MIFLKTINIFLVGSFYTYILIIHREYEYAHPEDLFRAFAKAVEDDSVEIGTDISDLMNFWVYQPGYPILDVKVDTDTGLISLEQVIISD